ncbi:DUF7118 family protein [Halomicrobium salinisoli]|uniref:DUF7118 family protein n=1 Tax=Halomicrobium salinisoli TaxID=2878391 RepID=UPI001CF0D2AC|nr:hypothetical protein [Halomicrobium salinisoli]
MTSTSDDDAAERLRRADAERRRTRSAVESAGEEDLRALREACETLRETLDRYEDRATGDGDFAGFIEFQDRIAHFTNDLNEDLPERGTFEDVDDRLQKRRLTESDFAAVRERVTEAEATAEPLNDWEDARAEYREARKTARRRLDELADRIDELERLQRLGEADLDAPVERIREPVEAYDESVRAAFREFRGEAPAREVLEFTATTALFPLVPFAEPPEDLREFVQSSEVGTEPIPQLLEYADYSRSKLDHYVDDPAALKRNVATRETYLRRLDAEPLTVGWPPPAADVLRWQCDERISVVARFAPDVVPDLRRVRELTRREDYAALRDSAVAREQLTSEERERLRSGAVERDLDAAREERERIEAALEELPSLDELPALP